MPDKVMTSTTAGPCTCCGEACFLTVFVGVDNLPSDAIFTGLYSNMPGESCVITENTMANAAHYLASASVVDCWLITGLIECGAGFGFSVSGAIVGQAYSLTATASCSGDCDVNAYAGCKVFIFAATGLDIDFSATASGSGGNGSSEVDVNVYKDGVFVTGDFLTSPTSGVSGTFHLSVPEDGFYEIEFSGFAGFESDESVTLNASFTLDEGATHCPVRAFYGTAEDPQYIVCE